MRASHAASPMGQHRPWWRRGPCGGQPIARQRGAPGRARLRAPDKHSGEGAHLGAHLGAYLARGRHAYLARNLARNLARVRSRQLALQLALQLQANLAPRGRSGRQEAPWPALRFARLPFRLRCRESVAPWAPGPDRLRARKALQPRKPQSQGAVPLPARIARCHPRPGQARSLASALPGGGLLAARGGLS